jgi:hypothetical protein
MHRPHTTSLQRPASDQALASGRPAVRAYTGIGSRRTPASVRELMRAVGARLAAAGWTLRSGGAAGADQAFQAGAAQAGGAIELYLPWPTFQAANLHALGAVTLRLERPTPAAAAIAARWHPGWAQLSPAARSLHARNSHEVLGADVDAACASRFVLCWTPDASLDGSGRASGGSGQALRIAVAHDVAVFNLACPDHEQRIRRLLERPHPPRA